MFGFETDCTEKLKVVEHSNDLKPLKTEHISFKASLPRSLVRSSLLPTRAAELIFLFYPFYHAFPANEHR